MTLDTAIVVGNKTISAVDVKMVVPSGFIVDSPLDYNWDSLPRQQTETFSTTGRFTVMFNKPIEPLYYIVTITMGRVFWLYDRWI